MKATVLSAILSVGFCGVVLGEDRPAPPPHGGGGPGGPGPISAEMLDRAFGHLDANHDGEIDKSEFEEHFPKMMRRLREHRMGEGAGGGPHGPGAGDRGPRADRGPGEGRESRRPGPPPRPLGAKPPLGGPQADRPERPERPELPERGRGGPEGREGRGEGAPGGPGFVVLGALDANHDRTIDMEELKNASAALAKLDVNGDGEITGDELREAGRKHQGERSAKKAGGEKKKAGKGKKANKEKSQEG